MCAHEEKESKQFIDCNNCKGSGFGYSDEACWCCGGTGKHCDKKEKRHYCNCHLVNSEVLDDVPYQVCYICSGGVSEEIQELRYKFMNISESIQRLHSRLSKLEEEKEVSAIFAKVKDTFKIFK